jgi:hypothetical protein
MHSRSFGELKLGIEFHETIKEKWWNEQMYIEISISDIKLLSDTPQKYNLCLTIKLWESENIERVGKRVLWFFLWQYVVKLN